MPALRSEQAGHSGSIGIIEFQKFLSAKTVSDWRLELFREVQYFVVGISATGTAEYRNPVGLVKQVGKFLQFFGPRLNRGARMKDGMLEVFRSHLGCGNVAWQYQNAHTAFRN